MKILYPVPEFLPGKSARFIQILNTCRALAESGCRVSLCAGVRPGVNPAEVFDTYGLDVPPGLELVRLPVLRGAISWHVPFHFSFLMKATKEPGESSSRGT